MHQNVKEPVIRLNKDIREEILGNVMQGRFPLHELKRKIALEGYDIIKDIYADFRERATSLLKEAPKAMAFSKHGFDIGIKRVKGNAGRRYTIYTEDFFTADDRKACEDADSYQEKQRRTQAMYSDVFDGELESRKLEDGSLGFIGFIVPTSYVYPTKARTKKLFKLVDELVQREKDRSTLNAQTSAVLNSCYTMKQLTETWPNVVNYAPTLIPSPTGFAMTIRIEDIDALIEKGA